MSTYPIDATSISFNDIKRDLFNFVENKPDSSKWKDYYEGSEGTILVEFIAGYGFYNALKVLFSREETYLAYVNQLSSARAIAQNYSYSAFRGKNKRYTISFTSPCSVTIPKNTIIGSADDYDVIVSEDVILRKDEVNKIEVIVGNLQEASIQISSSDLQVFRFNMENISNDYTLLLLDENGTTILPTTENSSESLKNKYLVRTNAVGGVDVMYMNREILADEMYPAHNLEKGQEVAYSPSYTYRSGSVLTLRYVQYKDISTVGSFDLTLEDENSSYFVDSESIEINRITALQEPESIESVQAKAPLMYETQQLIRSREDYTKNFLLSRAVLKDTTERDLSPAYVELSYSRADGVLFDDSELEGIRTQLSNPRTAGIPKPYINHPNLMQISLNIKIRTSGTEDQIIYESRIAELLSQYEYKFSDEMEIWTLDLAQLERDIETLKNIKRADVAIDRTGFISENYYGIGDVLYVATNKEDETEYAYRIVDIAYRTGQKEPDWSTNIGDIIEDGDISWEVVPKTGYPKAWKKQEYIKQYDTRVASTTNIDAAGIMYRAVKGYNYSSLDKIQFPELVYDSEDMRNNLVYDHEIIWKLLDGSANPTDPEWAQNQPYTRSDTIKNGGFSYQMIGARKRAMSNPETSNSDFAEEFIHEGMVLKRETVSSEEIEIPWGTYCIIKPKIKVVD